MESIVQSKNALTTRWLLVVVAVFIAASLVIAKPDLDKMQSLALSRYGQDTANTVAEWRAMIDKIQPMTDQQKTVAVNDFFNTRIRWVQDPEAWGQKDYWATPLETMAKRMGDCEDFAIAKYATLILAGVDVNKLRITYVKARMGGAYSKIHEAHMVLAYYPTPSGMPEILDNLITDVRPASQRTDLKPVYGFNSNGLWVGGAAAPATKDPGAKLSRWRDLLQRAAAEGLG
ncbi:MAG: transglutaminase-like cysteine peptidase [Halieaceae bacterium]